MSDIIKAARMQAAATLASARGHQLRESLLAEYEWFLERLEERDAARLPKVDYEQANPRPRSSAITVHPVRL